MVEESSVQDLSGAIFYVLEQDTLSFALVLLNPERKVHD